MRRSRKRTKVSSKVSNCTSEMSLSRNVTGREFQRVAETRSSDGKPLVSCRAL